MAELCGGAGVVTQGISLVDSLLWRQGKYLAGLALLRACCFLQAPEGAHHEKMHARAAFDGALVCSDLVYAVCAA